MNNLEVADRLICSPNFRSNEQPLEVVVPLNQASVGCRAAARIEYVCRGIDWDMGRMFICTDKELVSWDYLEHYIPDIREQLANAIHERDIQAWREMNKRKEGGDD